MAAEGSVETSTVGNRGTSCAKSRELLGLIRRRAELEGLISEAAGHAWLPDGIFGGLPDAISFATKVYEDRRHHVAPDPRTYRGADLLSGDRYETAPPFFDLALSDEILQLASDYLGELPVLLIPRLWWTRPEPQAERGLTQMFHRGRPNAPHIRRQAKFLFTMSDVDENSGPFHFITAELSERIIPDYRSGDCLGDEEIFRHVRPSDVMKLIGPPGTGLMVDTARCFHFGRRARSKERLMLMIQFMRSDDVPDHDRVARSPGFVEKHGHDPLRMSVVPGLQTESA
jgi:hypothetical protein